MSTIASQLLADLPTADVMQILDVFADEVARLARTVATQAALGDRAGVKRAAHSLAGAAGTVGATDLERVARAAMRDSGDGDLAELAGNLRAQCDSTLREAKAAAARISTAA